MVQVAAALIWRGDRFMICQRPVNKTRALEWEFVGGKAEAGETLQQTLVRECMEEIGVEVTVGDIFMELDHVYPDIPFISLSSMQPSRMGMSRKCLSIMILSSLLRMKFPFMSFVLQTKKFLKKSGRIPTDAYLI